MDRPQGPEENEPAPPVPGPPTPPAPTPPASGLDAPGFAAPDAERGFRVDRVTGVQLLVALFFLSMFAQVALFLTNVAAFPHYVSFLDQILNTAPLAFAAWLAFGRSPVRELGFALPSPRLAGILAGLAASNLLVIGMLVTLALTLLYPHEVVREQVRSLNQAILVADTPLEKTWMLLTIVVGAPIAEELFYRGLLQNLLVRWFRPAVGITVAAAIFTLAHWQTTRFPAVFAIGLLLGLVYHRTRSLPACMAMHAINNGLIATGFLFPGLHRALFGPIGLLVGLPLLAITATAFLRETRTRGEGELAAPTRFAPARLLFLLVPWGLGFSLSFLAGPMAGPGARELRDRSERIAELTGQIDDRFATDVAWSEMSAIRSACRGAVKRGEVETEDYVAYLETADEWTKPLEGAEPEYFAASPTDPEREVLDRLRTEAERRFALEIPLTPPFY